MMAQEMDLKKKGEQLPSFMGDELIAGTGVYIFILTPPPPPNGE